MEELKSLVIRARSGDLEAFGTIVRRFQDMAYGCAYSFLGDFHLAEDVAQEAFIEVYRQLPNLRNPEAFPGWFRRIIFKYCDRITRSKYPKTISLDAAVATAANDAGPAQMAEQQEVKGKVLEAVSTLPEHQRMVTTLFYINGYSQRDIAEFLEVPVTTVKKRLHDSRERLKERMIDMIREALKDNAPDERFSQRVIAELLARPRPLEIEGHPVRQIWEEIRNALPDYEVVMGEEIEDKKLFEVVQENMERAYHVGEQRALRTQMTITTFKAIQGRKPPVRLIAPGRVFRPEPEDETHLKVFHQVDGICIERGASLVTLKATCEQVLEAVFGPVELRWHEYDFGFVDWGLEAQIKPGKGWLDIVGCGMLKPETLRQAGYDPDTVNSFAFGFGLERIAMLKLGIDDIRKLWRSPYVPKRLNEK